LRKRIIKGKNEMEMVYIEKMVIKSLKLKEGSGKLRF
jgi:hypothetical protein